ncbi:MAG: hypothetical protein ABSG68_09130 [Thermoguttaceae bacterium]|jgi:hypothetical protein
MDSRRWFVAAGSTILIFTAGAVMAAAAEKESVAEFPLREVGLADKEMEELKIEYPGGYSIPFAQQFYGERPQIGEKPFPDVKKYPPLESKHPIYGCLRVDANVSHAGTVATFNFVVDESGGTGKGYDRLYLDLNGDLDLTNDPVVKPMKEPPPSLGNRFPVQKAVVFDYVTLKRDYGPGIGVISVRALPTLYVWSQAEMNIASATPEAESFMMRNYFMFTPATVRRGTIRFGSQQFDAVLYHAYQLSGRYDQPETMLYRKAKDQKQAAANDSGTLAVMPRVDGQYYSLSATPTGDKLLVKPYRGQLGVLEIGPGNRKIKGLAMEGTLESKDATIMVRKFRDRLDPDTEKDAGRSPAKAASAGDQFADFTPRCTLPVGDYLIAYLTARCGDTGFSVQRNYRTETPTADGQSSTVYPLKIRADKPFVLDFAAKPVLHFSDPYCMSGLMVGQPTTNFHPGDTIQLAAYLLDPKLDVMISDLRSLAGKTKTEKPPAAADVIVFDEVTPEKKKESRPSGGSLLQALVDTLIGAGNAGEANVSVAQLVEAMPALTPIVTITNSSGKQVASGKMPFG